LTCILTHSHQGPEIIDDLEEMKGHMMQHLGQRSRTAPRISAEPTATIKGWMCTRWRSGRYAL